LSKMLLKRLIHIIRNAHWEVLSIWNVLFHETKNIISGEGGMLVINDDKYVKRAEIIREKGLTDLHFSEVRLINMAGLILVLHFSLLISTLLIYMHNSKIWMIFRTNVKSFGNVIKKN
jgi:hypothetical protein